MPLTTKYILIGQKNTKSNQIKKNFELLYTFSSITKDGNTFIKLYSRRRIHRC